MATLSQVGIPGVGNGILQPKAKNRWRALFTGLGGVSASNASVPNDLSLQVITATRPRLSWEEIQLDRYTSRAYVLGKHSFEEATLTVEDDVTNRATHAIQSQLETQQRLIGASGPWLNAAATAFSYKFTMQLEMLDGNEAVTESWIYEGCSIKSVSWGDMDYATGEKVVIDLAIRYDHARQNLNSVVTGSAIGGTFNG